MRICRLVVVTACALMVNGGTLVVAASKTGDTRCGRNYCLAALYDADNQAIDYTLTVSGSGPSSGWYGIGQGEKMAKANMMVSIISFSPYLMLVASEVYVVSSLDRLLGSIRMAPLQLHSAVHRDTSNPHPVQSRLASTK
jgi:hypothetical protein